MDFVTKLPKSCSGHDTIWGLVDRLTKSAHFLPIREDYKTEKLAKLSRELPYAFDLSCRGNYMDEVCSICCVKAGNSFVNDPNPNSFNNSPNFFNHPPQPQMYSCELCGNDAHYGYDCLPQVPLVYEPEPGPHESYQCQSMNQNYYDPNLCYNFNSSGFDQYQPPQYSVTHQTPMAELLLEEKLSQALQALCEKLNKNVQEKQEEKNVAEEQATKVSS
ncbi:putative reverse transcriptase domain-containing protein [Tanacetum coccineum]